MSGYYPPNPNVPPQYYNINPNGAPNPNLGHIPQMMAPDGSYAHAIPESPVYHAMSGPFVPYSDSQMPPPYVGQYEDVPGAMDMAQGGNARVRRRPGPGEQVKHRRTRSGCYTCRQRRVKCDETHPTCERCRKGNRECNYPEPQSTQKAGRAGSKAGKMPSESSSPEDHDEDPAERLPAIMDEEEDEFETDKDDVTRESSETPALTLDRSPSPTSEPPLTTPVVPSRPQIPRKGSHQGSKPASGKPARVLPEEVQFYLSYFKSHMSHHHYALKRDTNNFLKTEFLAQAMKYEPLLYAVVGFAAYFHTLSQPDGRMNTFLQYYNESVTRLRISITKNKKQGLATFLTILQLAAIEEVLGDWVNLMGHQKAAYDMLTRLYTPETIVQSEFLLKVLLWYTRFDLFVALQSGGESVLSQDWYLAVHNHYRQMVQSHPDDLGLKYEERFAYSRMVAKESNELFSRKAKGLLSDEAFMKQLVEVTARIDNLERDIDPVLLDSQDKVTVAGTPDPDSVVNPHEPGLLWDGPRWTTNLLIMDMYGIVFMHHISVSMAMRRPFDPAYTEKAFSALQAFEAIRIYPNAVPGAVIEAQATMAIACIFMPKDVKTTNWCRRQFVRVETAGYIYSDVMRNRMLEGWGIGPSDWWLPNDEGCPRIIRSIKNFIRERTMAPKDQISEDLREMRGIFSTLTMSDSPPEYSAGHTPTENTNSSAPSSVDGGAAYTGGSPDYSSAEGYRSGPYVSQ